ncbi:uncharacterized protein HMPREF1541_05677 [Cyphellophora europaea CBS 101466]|uniref:Clr5 domain-containing protein n=1 Tax=Cyphellophora europaea (strain CBS 101466) TaxID=1220924 RepID=W2RUT5_CYPE1|nr:uncharacterized protein HMPREF1541_05677 [Cyphellophora europaea CBS 101466]ETN39454.1 hypothetical protein HMPREF1541_05677 [Cyphellophora europaea CBS 101466]
MAKDWAPLQEDVRDLYHLKNKPLKEVMRLIRGRHNFIASERAYRTQLQKWGYMKYNTQTTPYQRSKPAPRRDQFSQPRRVEVPSGVAAQGNVYAEDLVNERSMAPMNASYDVFDERVSSGIAFPFASSHYDPEGKTPLHHAVIKKDLEQVRNLLNAGAAVDIKDFTGSGSLHYGVLTADLQFVQLLLRYGAEANAKGPFGRTPLHQAVSMSNLAITETLLRSGSMVSELDDNGDSPLHIASRLPYKECRGVPPLITRLLQSGADVNLVNKNGLTVFHTLLDQPFTAPFYYWDSDPRCCVRATILTFFDHNANVKTPFPDARTPMQVFLNRSGYGWAYKRQCSQHAAANFSEARIMSELLDRCDPSELSMAGGESLAHYYICTIWDRWRVDCSWASKLCQLAEPHQLPSNGNSLLHELMCKPKPATDSLVADLLRRGWDPNQCNKHGQTPLHLLLQVPENRVNRPVIEKLLVMMSNGGANLWIRDNKDTSVLSKAATRFMEKDPSLIRALLRLEIDREGVNPDAWTGWESARRVATFAEVRQHLNVEATISPPDLDHRVRKEAYAALAEKHLELAKEEFPDGVPDYRRQRRAYMVDILKSCRACNVTIDMRFFDELLELC